MSTTKPAVIIYIKEENKRKLKILADNDGRSISNYIESLIVKAIKEYEINNNVTL